MICVEMSCSDDAFQNRLWKLAEAELRNFFEGNLLKEEDFTEPAAQGNLHSGLLPLVCLKASLWLFEPESC